MTMVVLKQKIVLNLKSDPFLSIPFNARAIVLNLKSDTPLWCSALSNLSKVQATVLILKMNTLLSIQLKHGHSLKIWKVILSRK